VSSHTFRIALAGADALCPERCAACSVIVGAGRLFCHACRPLVNVLGAPECPRCGAPDPAARLCPRWCADPAAPIRYARAWAEYEDPERPHRPVAHALASFKYGGARRLGRRIARAMLERMPAEAGALIAPIPLHPRRLRRRGFNQSAVVARHVARALGWPVALRLLVRVRDTPSQTALSAAARAANVAGAFVVARPDRARDRRIVLVDDVWTSGATARAAAAALRVAGAASVDVLTFARVL
jgi:ComF family protein